MKRCLVFLLVSLSPLAAIGLGDAILSKPTIQARVYSTAAVQSGLTHDPAAWMHRTLLVRGVAEATACTLAPDEALCGTPWFSLRDPDPADLPDRLDLVWGPGDPLLTVLRRVPLVGAVLPAPHAIRWGVIAVYRVQLRVERPCGCACYEALLLDAVP